MICVLASNKFPELIEQILVPLDRCVRFEYFVFSMWSGWRWGSFGSFILFSIDVMDGIHVWRIFRQSKRSDWRSAEIVLYAWAMKIQYIMLVRMHCKWPEFDILYSNSSLFWAILMLAKLDSLGRIADAWNDFDLSYR